MVSSAIFPSRERRDVISSRQMRAWPPFWTLFQFLALEVALSEGHRFLSA